jgi:hypothetical protein
MGDTGFDIECRHKGLAGVGEPIRINPYLLGLKLSSKIILGESILLSSLLIIYYFANSRYLGGYKNMVRFHKFIGKVLKTNPFFKYLSAPFKLFIVNVMRAYPRLAYIIKVFDII